MRRFRNPRYAPEALERKLSPSGVVAIPIMAEIYIPKTQMNNSTHATPTVHSTPIPVVPAASKVALAQVSLDTVPKPTRPGDPVPVDPEEQTEGTDPAPPDGDGSPPKDHPSIPGGPDDPSI